MHPEDALHAAGMLAEDLLGLELGEPRHLLAHRDFRRFEQIGKNQKTVALDLRHLRRVQYHVAAPLRRSAEFRARCIYVESRAARLPLPSGSRDPFFSAREAVGDWIAAFASP